MKRLLLSLIMLTVSSLSVWADSPLTSTTFSEAYNDIPMVQTLAFIFAILIVVFNLIADVLYGFLDPRIRYD